MRIRTRFLLAGAISALILAVGGVGVAVGVREANDLQRRSAVLWELVGRLHVLRALTFEYLQGPNERRESQWRAEYNTIQRTSSASRLLTADLAKVLGNTRSIFALIVADTRSRGGPDANIPRDESYRRQLSAALLADTQRIIDWARGLALEENERLTAGLRFYSVGAVLVLATTILVSAILLFPLGLHTMRSISTMKKGTDALSGGDLEHRIALPGKDEFSELATAFNSMTARLRDLYTTIGRTNRALRTHSACSQILVKAADQTELLSEICKLVVHEGGYRFCWVGLADEGPGNALRPAASFGDADADFIASLLQGGAGAVPEPVTAAVSGGAPVIIQDVDRVRERCPWCASAKERGFLALMGLPLVRGGRVLGGLGICGGARDLFTDDEIDLLQELAADISYGICALRDRIERRHGEERLWLAKEELEQRYEELKKIDVIKDGLLYDVTHELKTPVAKLFMQIEILRTTLDEPSLVKVEGILRVMERAAQRQQKVIKDMLTLARLEAGGRKSATAPLRIDEVLRGVVEDYRPTIEATGGTVATSLAPLMVKGNGELLWHVFSNLVNNAMKFRKTGLPCAIDVSVTHAPEGVAVRIRDEGIGIRPEELPRVFDRFYQATPSSEGSGVGLSICRIIMEEMGGGITLTSEGPDKGATATVTLPRA